MSKGRESILVVIPFAFHRETGSSLSSYYRVLALTYSFDQVDVVATPHGKEISSKNLLIIRAPVRKLFRNYQPGAYKKRLVYEWFLLCQTIKRLNRKKYRAVVIHGSSIYWAFWLQKLYKMPFIAMVHGNIQVELEKWRISSSRRMIRFASIIENKIINTFSHVIAEHESVKTLLINAGISRDRITLIRICVKSVAPVERSINKNEFTILYTGTFVKVQNLDLIYQTAKLLKGRRIKFLVIGGIEDEILQEQNRIIEYGIKDLVKLLPRMEQKKLRNYYKIADIVISPREFGHDTPMKIFDYLNLGKCILATNRPIHTGVLSKKTAWLTESTPEAFSRGILYLMNNPKKILKLEKRAKENFEKNFNFEIMKNQYKNLINKLKIKLPN